MSGYLIGFFSSGVAAVLFVLFAAVYIPYRYAGCAISLGCPDDTSPSYVLLGLLGGYLLTAAGLAAFASRRFDTRPVVAFLINLVPLPTIIAALFLKVNYREYAHQRDRTRAMRTAISEAPAIHLGEPYVKIVDLARGGVSLFLHVPFRVDRTVQPQSLHILVTSREPRSGARYSSTPGCNSAATEPPHGFNIVDRQFTERPLPASKPTRMISGQLNPGVQYYLLRELRFSSACRVSDYSDFDPKQFTVVLDLAAAKERLERGEF